MCRNILPLFAPLSDSIARRWNMAVSALRLAQRTTTASGASLGQTGVGPYLTHAKIGIVTDWEITDANNRGLRWPGRL